MPPRLTIRRLTVATTAVAVALAIVFTEVADVQVSTTPTGNTANVWIDANGGTCARQTLQVYNDAAACSSAQAAYTAASCGDTVRYRDSGVAYGSATISTGTKSCTSGTRIVFRPEDNDTNTFGSPATVVLGGISVTKANCWCEFWDFDQFDDPGVTNGSVNVDPGSVQNAEVVIRRVDARRLFIRANNVQAIGGSAGGFEACAFSFDDAVNVTHDGTQPSDNVLIEGYTLHDITRIGCADHADLIQLLGGSNVTIRGNKFDNGANDNFLARPQSGSVVLEDIVVENNMFGGLSLGTSSVNVGSSADRCVNVKVRNNSGVGTNTIECGASTSSGNTLSNNIGTTCGLVNATGSFNVGTSSGGGCGSSSKTCTPSYVNGPPSSTVDFRLNTGDTCAKNSGTSGAGLFAATDYFGTTRPLGGVIDIGAHEVG